MATPTYIALATTTLGATASSVTFSSIPATYRDLVLVIRVPSLTGSVTTTGGNLTLNGTGGDTVYAYGAGSGSGTSGTTNIILVPINNGHGTYICQIMDYSATDKHKTILTRAAAPSDVWMNASRWASTSAVTSIAINAPDSGTDEFGIGSTFSLFGIAS